MWKFIKKWWFLKHLSKEIAKHTCIASVENLSRGNAVLLSQQFFIVGTKEYPGLAMKSIHRFSWILRWRIKYNEKTLKKRIQEYNDIFNVCVEEGYIIMKEVNKYGILVKEKMPSTATSKYDKINGIMGLFNAILKEYDSVWKNILLPIITFVLGIVWSSNLLSSIKSIWKSLF
jgi:hypothetical protein